jgi:hypothetical protein
MLNTKNNYEIVIIFPIFRRVRVIVLGSKKPGFNGCGHGSSNRASA